MNSMIGKPALRYLEIVSEVPNSTVAISASAMARRGSSGGIRPYTEMVFPVTPLRPRDQLNGPVCQADAGAPDRASAHAGSRHGSSEPQWLATSINRPDYLARLTWWRPEPSA